MTPPPPTMDERLRSLVFDASEARDAIRGLAVPRHLGRRVTRLCLIRGIRHHDALAAHPDLVALRARLPDMDRAVNARAIMSNSVPHMADASAMPYCIWHPATATEHTYRELARRYPAMVYNVARACAVAGYTDLYLELHVLPDVSIAEEARAGGSDAIYRAIMRSPVLYRVMDDYTRTVNLVDPAPSGLNGDAALRPSLEVKQAFKTPSGPEPGCHDHDPDIFSDSIFDMLAPEAGFSTNVFDITEDMNIDEFTTPHDAQPGSAMADLLARPLPAHLPQGNKDVLILAAAYNGDMDRYARLRRPTMIDKEACCLVRGIYHSPLFATWWSSLPVPDSPYSDWIMQAINARMIMSNDLSRLQKPVPHAHLPYLIWYPDVAQSTTYAQLARWQPAMRPAILRAAVYTGDRPLFDSMLDEHGTRPDPYVLAEAKVGHGADSPSYFARRLLARADELGLDIGSATSQAALGTFGRDLWKRYSVRPESGLSPCRSDNWLPTMPVLVAEAEEPGFYNGLWADGSMAELFASVPPRWRPVTRGLPLDYAEWPPR